jgi:hypothetical protein
MTNTTINVNVHNTSTEILIITSQTVFFILLFLLLKNGLIDRRGMLNSKDRVNDEIFQIMAIFFAIFVIIGMFMIPIESYEYAHFVVPITYVIMIIIVAWEFYIVFVNDSSSYTPPESTKGSVKRVRFNDVEIGSPPPSSKINKISGGESPPSSKFWSNPTKSTFSFGGLSSGSNSQPPKRPVNF